MKFITFFTLFLSLNSWACDGGLATSKNKINIPVGSPLAGDMTEQQYKSILTHFQNFFLPMIDRDHNAELIVISSWASNAVNAFADQRPGKMIIQVYGGLARHRRITQDGLTGVLCHELGHHLGGYPKKTGNRWSSAEGQADYYTTMKCLRRIWERTNNLAVTAHLLIPLTLRSECARTYATAEGRALCHRMGMAGHSVSLMLQELDQDSIEPKFETPDRQVVTAINYLHPYSQCRLDTFFQGAVCPVSQSVEFNNDDESQGACHSRNGDIRGLRPACWFVTRR